MIEAPYFGSGEARRGVASTSLGRFVCTFRIAESPRFATKKRVRSTIYVFFRLVFGAGRRLDAQAQAGMTRGGRSGMAGLCYAGSSREGRTPGVRCELAQALDDLGHLGHSSTTSATARALWRAPALWRASRTPCPRQRELDARGINAYIPASCSAHPRSATQAGTDARHLERQALAFRKFWQGTVFLGRRERSARPR